MKRKIIKYLSSINWIYRLTTKVVASRIVGGKPLTQEYLESLGWVETYPGVYVEPSIKDRDRITIAFENHYYRVYHSSALTFVALKSTQEWFDNYYALLSGQRLYELAGI